MTEEENGQNHQNTKDFVEILFSEYFAEHDGYLELRFIGKAADNPLISKFYRRGKIEEDEWQEILRLNEIYHVYFGVNPRPLDKRKKEEDIRDVVCLWVDVDGKDFPGGKEEALRQITDFAVQPTVVVDSGHGYHCYWGLREPILGISGEQRVDLKQCLSGIVQGLKADRSKIPICSCLRLPGTWNLKEDEPLECRVVQLSKDKYDLDRFKEFQDVDYSEPKHSDEPLPSFGSKELLISFDNYDAALADIERLEIPSKVKTLIITGALLKGKGKDTTRSGRDMSILYHLISNDYNYPTIQSIFLNSFLKCSNRIRQEGEDALRWDVQSSLEFVQAHKREGTPGGREIDRIKGSFLSPEEKRKSIQSFVIGDLLTNPVAAGEGFVEPESDRYYFFDISEKMLMNLESTDFHCYMRARYEIANKDFEELKDAVMTAIWTSKKKVTPRRFAYFDREEIVLYISDHQNGVYRLDGKDITYVNNGIDAVFFEYDPTLTPFTFIPEQEAVNYFETEVDEKILKLPGIGTITFPKTTRLGLSLERFFKPDALLNRFLVERASFDTDKEQDISPYEQKFILIIYFYSLFFESIQGEKPIACFVGDKASGKSFIATSIGKLFFGNQFESSHEPKSEDDLAVTLWRNYYLVLDNLDKSIPGSIINMLCSAATGLTVKKRELYSNDKEISFTPHCFLAITSREPKFKRPDFVDRLLLFYTQKINTPISRSYLYGSLLENRNAIMTEVLTNLNTIVKILLFDKAHQLSQGEAAPAPRGDFRIQDWETFCRTICGGLSRFLLRHIVMKEQENQDRFVIEDDYICLLLNHLVYDSGEPIIDLPSSELYSRLVQAAEATRLKDFQRIYKSAGSMGKHLAAIKEELEQAFQVKIQRLPNNQKLYTFKRLADVSIRIPMSISAALVLEADTDYTPEEVLATLQRLCPETAKDMTTDMVIRAFENSGRNIMAELEQRAEE